MKSTTIVYRGHELIVTYDVINDSFDHAFGTEKVKPYNELTAVFVNNVDITDLIAQKDLDLINEEIQGV